MLELKREAKEKSKDEPTVTEQSQDTTGKTMVSLKTEESKTTINKQSDFKRLLQEIIHFE